MTIQLMLYKDKEIIKQRLETETIMSVASSYKCSYGTMYYFISNYLDKSKFIEERSPNYGKFGEWKDKVKELFIAGKSLNAISKEIGIPISTVSKWVTKLGLNSARYLPFDKSRPKLKTHTETIKKMYAEGKWMTEIAKELGYSETCIADLLHKEGILTPKTTYTVNENYFEKIDSAEKAYILGWWYSDGNVMATKIRLSFQARDRYVLEWIKAQLEYTGPITKLDRTDRGPNYQNLVLLEIARKKMADDLIKLGCIPNKSLQLTFPTYDIVPQALIRDFILGFFEGDGCASKGFSLVSTKPFLEGVISHLPDCNITGLYLAHKNQEPPCLSYILHVHRRAEYTKVYNYLYYDENLFCLQRKRDKLKQLIESKSL